ncbi:MAG TPA: thermonuclease family protein [Anaerolineaceae bacterium]
MNQKPPSKTTHQSQTRSTAAFTPQQILILILVAILGIAAVTAAAVILLSPAPATAQINPTQQASALPAAAGTAVEPSPTASAAELPAGCTQASYRSSQSSSARVIDSNTIQVQTESGPLQVVFAGIDAARGGSLEENAVAALHNRIDGQAITLVQDVIDRDQTGQAPRYVFANGHFLNLELVQQGLAKVNPIDPDQACAALFQQAQEQAHSGRLGLWNPTPVPTRTFMPLVTLDPALQAPCDCSARPVCSDFRTHAAAQACFNACQDYNSRLDDNHDGIACPELP